MRHQRATASAAGPTVLVVDPDRTYAASLADRLEREAGAIDVLIATSGDEALDRVASVRVDAVVSEYRLPDDDAVAFLRRVREYRPDLPVLVVTAENSTTAARRTIDAGATDYLRKHGDERYGLTERRVVAEARRYRERRDTVSPLPTA